MNPPKLNPLTQADCDCLNKVLSTKGDISELLSCLEQCGVDVSELQAKHGYQQTVSANIKQAFFPLQP